MRRALPRRKCRCHGVRTTGDVGSGGNPGPFSTLQRKQDCFKDESLFFSLFDSKAFDP